MTSRASRQSTVGSRQWGTGSGRHAKLMLRAIALGYLGLLVAGPVAILIWQTFAGGLTPVWEALTRPAFLHALQLTLIITLIAVPLNTVFGILFALVIVRREFRGK